MQLIQTADNSGLMVDVETIRHSGNYERIGRFSLCHHSCVAGTTQLGNQIKQQHVQDLHYVRWKVTDPPIALN